ncbi:Eukaryotic translation initiation factor 2A [Desmophyllum pertusum]|uniref:Eukaryotic translation initiation factor 2A n=1 Tax=Desmophyllum pertusum TaxID=174260 RepID=A0A9X0D7J4_9CNID|nr:Eukaryotic translation initiation factor 2A [Desmophyllum pertusum]
MAATGTSFGGSRNRRVSMVNGPPSYRQHEGFGSDNSPRCRVMTFSSDGSLFAWCNGQSVLVVDTTQFGLVCRIPNEKTFCMAFSPKGTHLSTWEQYTANKDQPSATNNLEIWNLQGGRLVCRICPEEKGHLATKVGVKMSQCVLALSPMKYTASMMQISPSIATKLRLQGVSEFEVSPGPPPFTVAAYVPGAKGAPSYVRLFRHPNFDSPASVLANKSFFKADRVKLLWNKKGSAVLVVTATDVDKTGASYYGEQTLQYISTSGESSMIQLGKRGPIYSVQWSPNSKEFCVVYGFMPSKELWSRKDLKLISKPQASDSTTLEWSPDGEHILTATTSPRLREGNGYKVWHYTGSVLHEKSVDELWEVKWQPVPDGVFKEPVINYRAAITNTTQEQKKTPDVYRPPRLRGIAPSMKLHEHEPPQNLREKEGQEMSKSAAKNKKKREAKARAKQEQEATGEAVSPTLPSPPASAVTSTTLPAEKEKKLRNLKKKLRQIEDMKEQQKSGKTLEKNQLDKLTAEASLIKEIQELELGS